MIGAEDVVAHRAAGRDRYGVVTESYNDSSDEENDDSDEEERVKPGFVKVAWFPPSGANSKSTAHDQLLPEKKLKLIDRALLPGDAVRKCRAGSGSTVQRGFITSISLLCDAVLLGNRQCRLQRVPAHRLHFPTPFAENLFCVYQNYLGEIEKVLVRATIQLRNGDIYRVREATLIRYATDIFDSTDKDSYFYKEFFYPNQHIKFKCKMLKHAEKIHTANQENSVESLNEDTIIRAKVLSVETHQIIVSWILRCFSTAEDEERDLDDSPSRTLEGTELSNVRLLDKFSCLSHTLGDNVLLTLNEQDLKKMTDKQKQYHHLSEVAQHSVDMRTKQLRRPKTGRKKKPGSRPHHSAVLMPDPGSGDVSPDSLELLFLSLLELNKVPTGDDDLVAIAAETVVEAFMSDDIPANFSDAMSQMMTNLTDRRQQREKQLFQYMLSSSKNLGNNSQGAELADNGDRVDDFPKFSTAQDLLCCVVSLTECWKQTVQSILESSQPMQNNNSEQMETETVSTFADLVSEGMQSKEEGKPKSRNEAPDSQKAAAEIADSSIPPPPSPKRCSYLSPGETVAVKIVMTHTLVNIQWQDGTTETDVPSTEVEVMHHLDQNEFFPGDFVVDKRKENENEEKYGVVQSANFAERVCDVRWFSDAANDRGKKLSDEQMSVYDIADLDPFNVNTLDIVARVSDEDNLTDSNVSHNSSQFEDCRIIGTAGTFLGVDLETGLMRVEWAEGFESLVPHHNIININEDEMSEFGDDDDEEEDDEYEEDSEEESDDGSWATASPGDGRKEPGDDEWETEEEEEILSNASEHAENRTPDKAQPTKISEDNIVSFKRELSKDLDTQFQELDTLVKEGQDLVDRLLSGNELQGPSSTPAANTLTRSMSSASNDGVVIPEKPPSTFVAHLLEKFPKFRLIEETLFVHRYRNSEEVQPNKKFMMALKKELKMLSSSLPDGVFVRSFESRSDLFSCMIVGAEDTPYDQGLFLFDIHLPPEYPDVPPEVSFLSHTNGKLNPNLYEDGNVCLSLLGTWMGKGVEVWSKESSTLLQLFVSLQGLILNKTPYYNEAGYEKQRGQVTAEENAKMYNEMVIIRLVQSSVSQLRLAFAPEECFGQEIGEHFKHVGPSFSRRLRLWASAEVAEMDQQPAFPLFPLSSGFRTSLKRELERLDSVLDRTFPVTEDSQEMSEIVSQCEMERKTGHSSAIQD